MKIVCDTNVLISAVVYGGRPREVLETVIAGRALGFLSPALRDEFRTVLGRPKFGLTPQQVHEVCQGLDDILEAVHPSRTLSVIHEDPADNAVLECALEAGADCIVSGDVHLLGLGRFNGIQILRPMEFLETLRRGK